jgi:RND superfamily putative drug exporter
MITSTLLADVLSNEFTFTNDPESERADALITERVLGGEEEALREPILAQSLAGATTEDPEFQDYVAELETALLGLGPEVVLEPILSFLHAEEDANGDGNPDGAPVSEDGDTAMLLVQLHEPENAEEIEAVREVLDEHSDDRFRALMAGNAALFADFSHLAEEDLRKGETIGIAVAFIVMIVVFSAILAAVLPIVMAIFAIILAFAMTALVGQLVDFQLFVTNMITMIGLAVGIDYSLFIVSRYREERQRGKDKMHAIESSGATANRAVFFSGMTVVLALLGMMIIPTTIFRSLASGAIFVVLASLAASMTLLPALLALLGDRINWPRLTRRARMERVALASGDPQASLTLKDIADRKGGFWDRITRAVMKRPVISLVFGTTFMLVAASGYLGIESGFAGVSTLPDEAKSKEAFIVLQEEFAGLFVSPAEVVIDPQAGTATPEQIDAAIERLGEGLAADEAFAPGAVPRPGVDPSSLIVVDAYFRVDPNSIAAIDAVDRLRADIIPAAFEGVDAEVLVGGDTAMGADFFNVTDTYTPIVFLFVLGLSFMLLTVVFRSIVVPIKAIVMNLLSVFAAYGLVTAVFQEGGPFFGKWIADLLGFTQVEAIEAWLPLFLFSVLFGLSMDYEVFLLSRIREHYDYTHDNTESVAHGLRTTGAIITGAALIMVAVFGGFAAGTVVPLKQMGFGLAVAVFFDATIVRSILVPSSMKLLGDWNWYLPRWLQWLPDVKVEGEHAPHEGDEPEEVPTEAPAPA